MRFASLALGAVLLALESAHAQEIEGTSITFTIPDGVALGPAVEQGEAYNLTWTGADTQTFLSFSLAAPGLQSKKLDELAKSSSAKLGQILEEDLPKDFKITPVKTKKATFPAWEGFEMSAGITTITDQKLVHSYFVLRGAGRTWFVEFRGREDAYQSAVKVLQGAKPKPQAK